MKCFEKNWLSFMWCQWFTDEYQEFTLTCILRTICDHFTFSGTERQKVPLMVCFLLLSFPFCLYLYMIHFIIITTNTIASTKMPSNQMYSCQSSLKGSGYYFKIQIMKYWIHLLKCSHVCHFSWVWKWSQLCSDISMPFL